jgi:glycosyltransferase involved in cell wall biosynthesis
MKISYAITVCNELVEIQRLLDLLLKQKRLQDEIVVLVDNPCGEDDEMISTLYQYESHNHDHMTVWRSEFAGHFANWKNKLTGYCTGDYIFQIDADELPNENLIAVLPDVIEENENIDVYLVPRVNTVEGLTPEHIQKWGWKVNDAGWVNWPDYQWRIWKNKPEIQWINKVHERLEGFKTYTMLPDVEYFALYHPKTIEKQEKQNNYYETL